MPCFVRYDDKNATDQWDNDWVIPSTHRKVEEYCYITSQNFPDDIWREKVSKVAKSYKSCLQDFQKNLYSLPVELLACHSTWGERLCVAMRGKDTDNLKKLNACMPSIEWVKEVWDLHKDRVWDLNGIRLQVNASDDSEEEEEEEEELDDVETELEKAMVRQSEAVVKESRLRKRRGGKKAVAPGDNGSEHSSEDDDSSSDESCSDDEDADRPLDPWASRMAEEEAQDMDDGNKDATIVDSLQSIAAIPETEDDQMVIASPSKHVKEPTEIYSPVKASDMDTSAGLLQHHSLPYPYLILFCCRSRRWRGLPCSA